MTDLSKATPRPWTQHATAPEIIDGPDGVVGEMGFGMGGEQAAADAALTVRAVNSFDALVAALRRIVGPIVREDRRDRDYTYEAMEQAEAALKLAEGDS